MKTAVMGSGNGSQTMAADLAIHNHDVRLFEFEEFAENLDYVKKTGKIELDGEITGVGKINKITFDIGEAVDDADIIFLPLPAFAHRRYAELLADHVKDGQIIMLLPGTLGTLVFKRVFKEKNVKADVVICETNTLTYDTRITAPGRVYVYARNERLLIGIYPKKRTDEIFDKLDATFPYFVFLKGIDVLDCGLHSLNPVLHVPGCIMNAGRIERSKGEFYLYEEGITHSVARVMEKVDEERGNIIKKLGYRFITLAEDFAAENSPRSIWEEVNCTADLEFIKGPTSVKNRYFTEDIPYGLVAWAAIGETIGVDVSTIKSLINIGSLIIEQDSFSVGRTKDDMGIDGMGLDEIKAYVE